MVTIDLTGKTAVVTGAGMGIGKAIALGMGATGASTVVSDISLAAAEEVAQEIVAKGGTAIAVQTDVSDGEACESLIAKALETYKTVDILINNAGISIAKLFLDSTMEEFDKMVNINFKGAYHTCKAALPHMIENKFGRIINMASMSPKYPCTFHTMYAATKAAVIAMTQGIAAEYGAYNITANAICPGIVRTEMWDKTEGGTLANINAVVGADADGLWGSLVEAVPMKRAQSPEDIANTVIYLASDLAENISAQALNINGGQLAN